jgi:ATPase domain predominantly from Archaea
MVNGGYFPRPVATSALKKLLLSPPTGIVVVVGPKNCGKTQFLTNALPEIVGKDALLSINLREHSLLRTEEDIARLFKETASTSLLGLLPGLVKWFVKAGITIAAAWVASNLSSPLWKGLISLITSTDSMAMADALSNYMIDALPKVPNDNLFLVLKDVAICHRKLRETSDSAGPAEFPVLFVDEANKLQAILPNEIQRRRVFDTLFALTKEQKLMHVVFATSDFAMLDWMESEATSTSLVTRYLSNFSRSDAKKYFQEYVLPVLRVTDDGKGVEFFAEDWEKIYGVTGGNAGAILSVSHEYYSSRPHSMARALGRGRRDVMKCMEPNAQDGYTGNQFAKVAIAILDAPGGLAPILGVADVLGVTVKAAQDVVRRVLKENVISYLEEDDMAEDISKEDWKGGDWMLVAASRLHFCCMREFKEALLKLAHA